MRTLTCFLLLAACSEYGLERDVDPSPNARVDIEVAPMRLDFGGVNLGSEPINDSFEVRNVGRGLLSVERVEIQAGPFAIVQGAGPFELRSGEARTVDVSFLANAPGHVLGTASVFSNDPDESVVEVALAGEGRGPWLVVTPELHDFGAADIPCPDQVDVVMQNLGDAPVDVQDIGWTHDGQLSWTPDRQTPFTLQPGQFAVGAVRLQPLVEGAIEGRLEISSTDPRGVLQARQVASPAAGATAKDTAVIPADPPVDMIIAVDRSASMDDDAERLGESFGAFIGELERVTDAWRLGVVTLDSGCFNGGVITTGTPDAAGVFRRAVITGQDRDIADDEALFSLTDRALTAAKVGRCNAGFRRDDAALHIIVVSDEPERSPDRSSSLTWDHFVGQWHSRVSAPSLLKISGVIDLDACGGGSGGYSEAIADTGGLALSVCGTDWSKAAIELAKATLRRIVRVELSQLPVASTIVVEVNGVPVTGFTYQADTNSVVLDDATPGGSVEVRYTVQASCP